MDSKEPDQLWEAIAEAWDWSTDIAVDRLIEIRFCREDDTGIDDLSKRLTDSGVKCTQDRAKQRKPSVGAEQANCWLSVTLALRSLPKFLKAIKPTVMEWQNSRQPFDVVIKDRTLDIRVRDIKDLDAVTVAVEKLQARSETPRLPTKRERRRHPSGS
jgi:hypothetical protein